MKRRRLTNDNPTGNYDGMLNMTYIKDKEVYVRDWNGKGDISLAELCKAECKKQCNRDLSHIETSELADFMDCDCFVSYFYFLATGHAEIRESLKRYEDMKVIVELDAMPENCNCCPLCDGIIEPDETIWCTPLSDKAEEIVAGDYKQRREDCPLIPIEEGKECLK